MCPYCNGPLIQIDHYGEMLVGCINCNRWGHPGAEHLIMELMEDDLDALRRDRREANNRHKGRHGERLEHDILL